LQSNLKQGGVMPKVNLTKSFYIGLAKKLIKNLNSDKSSYEVADKIMRDLNFISSMYRFPKPTSKQMENIFNICEGLGVKITDAAGLEIFDIEHYKIILDLEEPRQQRAEYDF
jgi:hypothetical protein